MSDSERDPMVDKRAASRLDQSAGAEGAPVPQPPADSAEAEKLREQADQYYKNWQRSAADFINYKRRVEQEKGEQSRFATAATVINLLPIYDDLDRAVANVDPNLTHLQWVQGVVAISRKFSHLLESMGVTEINAAGEPFDPALHEAIARQPGEDGKVLHVAQRGYKLGDRVVRPAMVIVGEGGAPTES
ncbi:MAG: nucleotide exchange factor GrpE [Dehalococcoidia bacterium]